MSARLLADQVLLSVTDLSRRLGVHPNTLYNWRRTEKGPPWIQIANRAVYDLAAVEQWELETGRTRKGGDAAHP